MVPTQIKSSFKPVTKGAACGIFPKIILDRWPEKSRGNEAETLEKSACRSDGQFLPRR
jgi:hypothetical protein